MVFPSRDGVKTGTRAETAVSGESPLLSATLAGVAETSAVAKHGSISA